MSESKKTPTSNQDGVISISSMFQKIRSVKLCLMAHPDNEEHSEFADRISDLEGIENQLKQEIEKSRFIPDINERLTKTKELLELNKSYSYGDQYGLSDQSEKGNWAEKSINRLSKEAQFYEKALKDLDGL